MKVPERGGADQVPGLRGRLLRRLVRQRQRVHELRRGPLPDQHVHQRLHALPGGAVRWAPAPASGFGIFLHAFVAVVAVVAVVVVVWCCCVGSGGGGGGGGGSSGGSWVMSFPTR